MKLCSEVKQYLESYGLSVYFTRDIENEVAIGFVHDESSRVFTIWFSLNENKIHYMYKRSYKYATPLIMDCGSYSETIGDLEQQTARFIRRYSIDSKKPKQTTIFDFEI